MVDIERTLNVEYYDDISMRWIDVENVDYAIDFPTEGGILKFRFFVDNGEAPSNIYTAETSSNWVTLQRREAELWAYVDTNHINDKRETVFEFKHPKSRDCDIELTVTQARDVYDVKFETEETKYTEDAFFSGDESVSVDFETTFLIRGGRGEFKLYVQKERLGNEYELDDEASTTIEGWYPVKDDRSVEIREIAFFGDVTSNYIPDTISIGDLEVEGEEEAVYGLTYKKYTVGVRCYGPTDTDDYTKYRYAITAIHADDPANTRASHYVSYVAPSEQYLAPSMVIPPAHVVDWDDIKYDVKPMSEVGTATTIQHAPAQEQEIVYELKIDGTAPTAIAENEGSAQIKFIVSPETATVLPYQSSDFLDFAVSSDGNGSVTVTMTRNEAAKERDFTHRRTCKLRFSLSEYPTLFVEKYLTVYFPGPYDLYGIPNAYGTINIEGVEVQNDITHVGAYPEGTEIKVQG